VPGFDEQVYEGAAKRLEGYNSAAEQMAAQLGEVALVAMGAEHAAILALKHMTEELMLQAIGAHMSQEDCDHFRMECSHVAARLVEELQAGAEEAAKMMPGTDTTQ